ncbi:12832_t:CDS:2, partial [Funneliformis geosporum]
KAAAEIGRIGAGIATGADIILNETQDEDWSIAGSEPIDNAEVAPNVEGGFPAVTIASGIKLSQLLYLFRTYYTTVVHLKHMAVFGQLIQDDMSIEQFSTRIKKIGQDDVICDYEQHRASIVSEQIVIPSSSQHLDLVGKALCQKHYNRLIVNAKKKSKTYVCSHPKYGFYISTARHDTEGKKFKKALKQLIGFFELPQPYK